MNSIALHKIKKIHFVGIGGSGMNGIAQVLLNQGYEISGSDLSENSAIKNLKKEGARIYKSHTEKNIKDVDVVVISSAIKENNPEVIAAKKNRIPVIPRAQMLSEIMRFHFGIAIAGTHGKTTTTSLTASVLAEAGLDPTYVIGGRLNSSGSNAKLGKSRYFVVEADESDASFLYLQPMISVVTNIDIDHMETYQNDIKQLHKTFIDFLHHLPFYGVAIVCIEDAGVEAIINNINRPMITYGFKPSADISAYNLKQEGLTVSFDVKRFNNKKPFKVKLNLGGKHNVLNALSVIAIAAELAIPDKVVQQGLKNFSGVDRRSQVLGELSTTRGKVTVIDDYGHHPCEVTATYQSIKDAYPTQRVICVFQPHRYTRVKNLFEDFAQALSEVDFLIMLEVYPAGEVPIAGADSRDLCRNIRERGKVEPVLVSKPEQLWVTLLNIINDGDVILMQGAGSISALAHRIVEESSLNVI